MNPHLMARCAYLGALAVIRDHYAPLSRVIGWPWGKPR